MKIIFKLTLTFHLNQKRIEPHATDRQNVEANIHTHKTIIAHSNAKIESLFGSGHKLSIAIVAGLTYLLYTCQLWFITNDIRICVTYFIFISYDLLLFTAAAVYLSAFLIVQASNIIFFSLYIELKWNEGVSVVHKSRQNEIVVVLHSSRKNNNNKV